MTTTLPAGGTTMAATSFAKTWPKGAAGSSSAAASVTEASSPRLYPHTGSIESLKRVIAGLSQQQQQLEQEALRIRGQSNSVVHKRSVVTSTLVAKRNQLLMKNAPDEEVERLNAQIGAVMHKTNEATSRIEQSSRQVQVRLETVNGQLKKATADLLETNRQYTTAMLGSSSAVAPADAAKAPNTYTPPSVAVGAVGVTSPNSVEMNDI